METINRRLGARMKALRCDAGLSRDELAKVTGHPAGRIRQYEAGLREVEAGLLWKLSEALKAPVETFFEFDSQDQGQHRPASERLH